MFAKPVKGIKLNNETGQEENQKGKIAWSEYDHVHQMALLGYAPVCLNNV